MRHLGFFFRIILNHVECQKTAEVFLPPGGSACAEPRDGSGFEGRISLRVERKSNRVRGAANRKLDAKIEERV